MKELNSYMLGDYIEGHMNNNNIITEIESLTEREWQIAIM